MKISLKFKAMDTEPIYSVFLDNLTEKLTGIKVTIDANDGPREIENPIKDIQKLNTGSADFSVDILVNTTVFKGVIDLKEKAKIKKAILKAVESVDGIERVTEFSEEEKK